MPKKMIKPGILLATVFVVISLLFLTAGATTVNVLDGQVSVTDSANSNSVSNGTVIITAKGSLFSKKTNNITITNESGSQAELNFDYTTAQANSFKIAGVAATASGSYTVVLDAGASLAITLVSNSGLSNTTATLKLSNFSLTVVADSSNVTINYDSTLGSVTAGGNSAANGAVIEGVTKADGVVLAATPASGATFLGWVDGGGKILSSDATYTLKPASNTTVKAIFSSTLKPCFAVGSATQKSVSSGLLGLGKLYYHTVGTSYLFDDLNEAAAKAEADSTNKCVVLMNSGTLSAGTYTIPAGVTLLIPFDANNSLYTTQVVNTTSYTKPTAYRTLTMADGANLVINGVMSLSANQRCAQGSKADGGSPTGPASFVKMQGSSSITVNNGGVLYAYGFITGSGSVTANSGATVYEMFQFMDFRGGTQSTDMKNGVFPFSQYYVQNIEVPMKLYSGAMEYAYTTIYMSSADFGTAVNFIGSSGAMFNLTSGYVVKRYDGATDRMMIELYGDVTVSSINMSVGTSSIDSKNYELPINSNITVTAKSGSSVTIGQDLAFLPGSVMEIEEGATCTLGSGTNVYIYDADQWGNFTFGKDSVNSPLKPLTYAPGRTYNRTNADLVDATIVVNGTLDASKGYLYTTTGGANICSTGTGVVKLQKGTQTITYQLVQGTGYTEIPITPAKLKNADESYSITKNSTTDSNIYTYDEPLGKWLCETHTWGDWSAWANKLSSSKCECCAEVISVLLEYRMNSYIWLNATVSSTAGMPVCSDTSIVYGKYLVQKVPSDSITTSVEVTFTVKGFEGATPKLDIGFLAYKNAIYESADFETKALLDAMENYGKAADLYFDGDEVTFETKPVVPDADQERLDGQGAISNGNVGIKTNGAVVYFDEALRLSVGYDITGVSVDGTVQIGEKTYKVVQIGLLTQKLTNWNMSNVLTTDYALDANNDVTAYLAYNATSFTPGSGGALNYPYSGYPEEGAVDITTYLTNGEITFDLQVLDYMRGFALRTFAVLQTGEGNSAEYICVYGKQYGYGLEAYIKTMYAPEATTAFNDLLATAWTYAKAADAKYVSSDVIIGG